MSDHELSQAARDEIRASRLGMLWYASVTVHQFVRFSATLCSLWLAYLLYNAYGFLFAFGGWLILCLAAATGAAIYLAVASSIISFYFHAAGLWLPATACSLAGSDVLLVITRIRLDEDAARQWKES